MERRLWASGRTAAEEKFALQNEGMVRARWRGIPEQNSVGEQQHIAFRPELRVRRAPSGEAGWRMAVRSYWNWRVMSMA